MSPVVSALMFRLPSAPRLTSLQRHSPGGRLGGGDPNNHASELAFEHRLENLPPNRIGIYASGGGEIFGDHPNNAVRRILGDSDRFRGPNIAPVGGPATAESNPETG